MNWNHTLLKKFNNTGHFRLLNQVRTELRNHPLIRRNDTKNQNTTNQALKGTSQRTSIRANEQTKPENSIPAVSNSEHSTPSGTNASTQSSFQVSTTRTEPINQFETNPEVSKETSPIPTSSDSHDSGNLEESADRSREHKMSFRDRLSAVDMR